MFRCWSVEAMATAVWRGAGEIGAMVRGITLVGTLLELLVVSGLLGKLQDRHGEVGARERERLGVHGVGLHNRPGQYRVRSPRTPMRCTPRPRMGTEPSTPQRAPPLHRNKTCGGGVEGSGRHHCRIKSVGSVATSLAVASAAACEERTGGSSVGIGLVRTGGNCTCSTTLD